MTTDVESATSKATIDGHAIEVNILGPTELVVDARVADIPRRKERATLVAMALHAGRQVGGREVAAMLWGDQAPPSERKSVQMHVSGLRKVCRSLAPALEVILTSSNGYTLAVRPSDVDASRFEQLVAVGRRLLDAGEVRSAHETLSSALTLWRGDPLVEVAGTPVGDAAIEHLIELRALAIESQTDAALALGHHREIVGRIEQALGDTPYRERLWGQLMVALYRSGRQADALRAYQRARTALVEELGLEPGPDLRRIEAAVVGQDPSLDLVASAAIQPERSTLQAANASGSSEPGCPAWAVRACTGPFVDRALEMSRIEEGLRDAEHGMSVIAVSGDDGIGKTRLVAEAVLRASDSAVFVLAGQCHADRAPLTAYRQMIDRAADQLIDAGCGALGATASTLAGLSPSFADRMQLGAAPAPTVDPYSTAAALAEVVRRVGDGRPAMVVLDDLHLAVPSTIEVVRHFVTSNPELPVLVVLAFRGAETQRRLDLLDLLDDLHCLPAYDRVVLGPLPIDESVPMLRALLDPPMAMAADTNLAVLCGEVGGKPRYLVALARFLLERRAQKGPDWSPGGLAEIGLPPNLADLVRRQVRQLTPSHRTVLDAAAVVGATFDGPSVEAISGLTPTEIARALAEAEALGLVRRGTSDTEFTCQAVWLAVLGDATRQRPVAPLLASVTELRPALPVATVHA